MAELLDLDRIWARIIQYLPIALLFMFLVGLQIGMAFCPLLVSCETYYQGCPGVNKTVSDINVTEVLGNVTVARR